MVVYTIFAPLTIYTPVSDTKYTDGSLICTMPSAGGVPVGVKVGVGVGVNVGPSVNVIVGVGVGTRIKSETGVGATAT